MTKSLSKVDGIKVNNVNIIAGKAFVELEDQIEEKDLRKAVEYVGFKFKDVEYEGSITKEAKEMIHMDITKKEEKEHRERVSWLVKLIGTWILTIQIMFIMYAEEFLGIMLIPTDLMTPLMLILSFPIIFIFGFKTIKSGLRGFYKLYFSMDSLIALGTVIAFLTGILSFFMAFEYA